MIRTALRPQWLALLALLALVVYAFVRLGLWQLDVSSSRAAEEFAAEQAARRPVALEQVVQPFQTFPPGQVGTPVVASGGYDVTQQFLVPGRRLAGSDGYWVVTPLRTGDALIAVVRGFVTDPAEADRVPATPVTVTGALAPSESTGERPSLPAGQRESIDTADLANAWDEPLYNAFVFATGEEPQLTAAPVQPVPPPVFGASEGIDWRNLGYGVQWFVFAGFACYMYLRFLRDAAHPAMHPTDRPGTTPTGAPTP